MDQLSNQPSEEIKSRLDIVDVIQEYIQLKKAGANYKAVCPFHNEKTPSFMVSEDKQIWHCFGCSEGGDIFAFVMKMEGMEFPDALRLLAGKAGVELRRRDPELQTKTGKALEVLELATKYFQKVLLESKSAESVRSYLTKREVSDLSRDEFKIGYAVESWDALLNYLKKKGHSDDDILNAGLIIRRTVDQGSSAGSGFYDRFRDRLMFPIADAHGRTIGFGGRTLKSDDEVAKYVNSPQTLVYDKSRVIYGLDKAKTAIRKAGYAIVVEGYTDVIASHQAGITNVVSSSGTALTEGQLGLLKRYCQKLILAFDMDLAGDSATKRGIDLAIALGFEVKIAMMPKGEDPDELIKKSPNDWKQVLKSAKSIMDYYFSTTLEGLDLSKVEDKKQASKELLPVIKKIPDKVEQTHYLQELARLLKVKEEVLVDALGTVKVEQVRTSGKEKPPEAPKVTQSEQNLVSERILGLLLKYPEASGVAALELKEAYFSPATRELYIAYKDYYNNKGNKDFDFDEFRNQLNTKDKDLAEDSARLTLAIEKDFEDFTGDVQKEVSQEIEVLKKRLAAIYLKAELVKIEEKIRQAEDSNNKKDLDELTSEFNKLSLKLGELLK